MHKIGQVKGNEPNFPLNETNYWNIKFCKVVLWTCRVFNKISYIIISVPHESIEIWGVHSRWLRITCHSLLCVWIPPGTLDSFMWGSYPASLLNVSGSTQVSEIMHSSSSTSKAGKAPDNLFSVGAT